MKNNLHILKVHAGLPNVIEDMISRKLVSRFFRGFNSEFQYWFWFNPLKIKFKLILRHYFLFELHNFDLALTFSIEKTLTKFFY